MRGLYRNYLSVDFKYKLYTNSAWRASNIANGKKIAKQVLHGLGKGCYYFGKGLYIVGRAVGRDIQKEYRNSQKRRRNEEEERRQLREIERESYYAEKGRLSASRTQERDPYQEGYEQELGRQAAFKEVRNQKRRDAERRRIKNTLIPDVEYRTPKYEVRDPAADFLDDVEYARKKRKKKSIWDL